jgi:hypothetical protein
MMVINKQRRRRRSGTKNHIARTAQTAAMSRGHARALLVLGMHRSGTSALARMLALLGADLPKNLMRGTSFNEAGHWESVDLMVIHDRILASAGSAWHDWRKFNPDWYQSPAAEPLKQQLLEQLKKDFGGSRLFVVKDPRICRFVPLWLDVLAESSADPGIIVPVRNPIEVCASLKRRDGMLSSQGLLLWLRHVLDAEVSTRGLPRAVTTYEQLMNDWPNMASVVSKRTKIAWPHRSAVVDIEIERFLAPHLRHHAVSPEELNARAEIVDWVKIAHAAMLQLAQQGENAAAMRQLDDVREAFDKASLTFGVALAEQEQQVSQSKAEVATLIRDLTEARTSAEQSEIAARRAGAELSAVVQAAETAAAEHKAQLANTRAQSVDLERSVEAARSSLREAQTEVQRLSGEADVAKREAVRALEARDRAGLELAEALRELAAAQTEVQRLSEELGVARRKTVESIEARGRVSAELVSEQNASAIARAELASVRDEAAAVQALLVSERLKAEEMEERANSVRREFEAIQAKLNDSRSDIRRLSNEAGRTSVVHASAAEELRDTIARQARVLAAMRRASQKGFGGLVSGLFRRFFRGGTSEPASWDWEREAIEKSSLFDSAWYLRSNPDVAAEGGDPLAHYLSHGAAEGRDPHPVFDSKWYASQTFEIAELRLTPLGHYVIMGVSEALDPNPLFDTDWYLKQNPDVAAAHVNPLFHFMREGAEKGLDPHPLFDASWYLTNNPDIAAAGDNPLHHYLTHGAAEGRAPHPLFDPAWYLAQCPSTDDARDNPLVHFLMTGAALGLSPHQLFDSSWYLKQYPDVAKSMANPLLHYMRHGAAEGRNPHALFDGKWYISQNPEVERTGINPLIHYITSNILIAQTTVNSSKSDTTQQRAGSASDTRPI